MNNPTVTITLKHGIGHDRMGEALRVLADMLERDDIVDEELMDGSLAINDRMSETIGFAIIGETE